MPYNFDFIKNVKRKGFQSVMQAAYLDIQSANKGVNSNPRSTVVNITDSLHGIYKTIYKIYIKKNLPANSDLYSLINNNEINSLFLAYNSETYKTLKGNNGPIDMIRKTANRVKHEAGYMPSVEDAEALMSMAGRHLMPFICNFINDTVPKRQRNTQMPQTTQTQQNPRLTGKAVLDHIYDRGTDELIFELRREGGNSVNSDLLYFWRFDEKDDRNDYSKGDNKYRCARNDADKKKKVWAYISVKNYSGRLSASYGPVTSKDFEHIDGSVKIERVESSKTTKDNFRYMLQAVADINNNTAGAAINYTWIKNGEPLQNYNTEVYFLKKKDAAGTTLQCKITCPDVFPGDFLISEKYIIQENDLIKVEKYPIQNKGDFGTIKFWGKITPTEIHLFPEVTPNTVRVNFGWSYISDGENGERHAHCVGDKFTVNNEEIKKFGTKAIRCYAVSDDEKTWISADYRIGDELTSMPESESEPLIDTPAPKPKPEPKLSIDTLTSKPEPKPSIGEPTPQPNPEPKPIPKPTKTITGGFRFTKPAVVTAPNFKCFDSNISGLHYFVAPRDDYYALNSLQYLDFNEYLNNLLREQGYERTIIVSDISEDGGNNYPIIAYDRVSQLSFLNHARFENEFAGCSRQDVTEEKLNAFCDKVEAPVENTIRQSQRVSLGYKTKQNTTTPRFGKRVIKTIIRSTDGVSDDGGKKPKDLFEHFAAQEVAAVLGEKILKTAIVVPLELLLEKDYLTDAVSKCMKAALREHGENILIVTLKQETDFCKIFGNSDEYQAFENAITNAIEKLESNTEPMARCNALIEELTSKQRLLIASPVPGKDEVANLLMQMKLQASARFENLRWGKIYALAEFLVINCDRSDKTKTAFERLGNNTWNVSALKNLEVALRDDSVIEALVSLSERLCDRSINEVEGLNSTTLERIYATEKTQKLIEKYTISQEERSAENERATEELNQLIGLDSVKEMLKIRFAAATVGNRTEPGHYVFSGNPGTGKTVVARLIGQILHSQGILAKGHVLEVTKDCLVSNHVGESAIKTRQVCEEALDGVLFIDEAYQLVSTEESTDAKFSSSFDQEAYETLMKFMEDNRDRLCVICAGYPYQMEKFRKANPGMSRRIPEKNVITFPDYSPEELYLILLKMAKDKNVALSDEFKTSAEKVIRQMWDERDSEFGNAGEVRNFLEECVDNASLRAVDEKKPTFELLLPDDIPQEYKEMDLNADERKKLQEASMKKLDDMIGLENVKGQIKTIINRAKISRGRNKGPGSYIFAGNPGTGKTVVARMVGDIMCSYGILKKGHTVEVSKADLVAEYVGQSKIKALNQCKKALDGVLFVDEAYELVNTSPYADSKFSSKFDEEAYTTILKFMEDHKDRICVIFAGYKDDMQAFRTANPGMNRRIKKVIDFEDYSDEEMLSILKMYAEKESDLSVSLSAEFIESTRVLIPVMRQLQGAEFGNAGGMIKYLNESIDNAINRIAETVDIDSQIIETIELIKEDIPEEYADYLNLKKPEADKSGDNDKGDAGTDTVNLFHNIPRNYITELPAPYDESVIKRNDFAEICGWSVVRITNEFGSATAFIITPDGYAITCAHAVAEKGNLANLAKNIVAHFNEYNIKGIAEAEETFDAKASIVNTKPDLDMALIKIDAPYTLPYLKVAAEDREIKLNDKCTLYGYAEGRRGLLIHPQVVSSHPDSGKDGEQGSILYLSGDAYEGDSGGPVIDDSDGSVIGILRGAKGRVDGHKFNYMKPISYFWKEFLK